MATAAIPSPSLPRMTMRILARRGMECWTPEPEVRAGRPAAMRRIVILIAVALTACAGPGASTGPADHPTGNDLILRVAYSGGFAGPAFDYLNFPPFSLIGDGRVIVPGAQDAIFPSPALPAVNERRLTEAGIQAVLKEVANTDLFAGSASYGGAHACVMDASDTIFTLHGFGREVTVKVYGLGTIDSTSGCPGFGSAELAVHRTLLQLLQRLVTLEQWPPASSWADAASHPYRPAALRLLVRAADADSSNPVVDWPDTSDPASIGQPGPAEGQRCDVVSGQRADHWYTTLAAATQATRFVQGGHRYQVSVRLMLPDEPPECPKLPT